MDEAAVPPGLAPGGEPGAAAPAAAEGLDQWLVGMLPGGAGAEAPDAGFVNDLLGEDLGDDEPDAAE
jgi:hypothetical protein